MSFKSEIIKLLHKVYRNDNYINDMLSAAETIYTPADNAITRLNKLFHFNRLDKQGCEWWEELLNITDINSEIPDRQAKIRSKWLSNIHNDIQLIQKICDSWENGEVDVDFVDGKIKLKFIDIYGIPNAIESLLKSIEEVKPAHLALIVLYKYLLIKDIHEVKTLTETQNLVINMFAF